MPAPNEPSASPKPATGEPVLLGRLAALGPDAQGDIDESLLRDNLALTPFERLQAMSEAATQIEQLQRAMKAANDA